MTKDLPGILMTQNTGIWAADETEVRRFRAPHLQQIIPQIELPVSD